MGDGAKPDPGAMREVMARIIEEIKNPAPMRPYVAVLPKWLYDLYQSEEPKP